MGGVTVSVTRCGKEGCPGAKRCRECQRRRQAASRQKRKGVTLGVAVTPQDSVTAEPLPVTHSTGKTPAYSLLFRAQLERYFASQDEEPWPRCEQCGEKKDAAWPWTATRFSDVVFSCGACARPSVTPPRPRP